ncbi:zinc finger CCHC domain-containing protein 3 isoform 1-T1 [Dugong dugon]
MATGGGTEEEKKRGRPQLLPPVRPAARSEEPEGGREKLGWAQVVKNLAEKKGEFRESRPPRREEESSEGALGAPAGLAAPGFGDFPPAGRGDPKGRRKDPAGEAADPRKKKGTAEASRRKKAETVAMAAPARPGTAEDAAERPHQDEQAAGAGPAAGQGKGRFLVRICFQGDEGACPTRDFVVGALILRSIGMDPSDIYAVIQIPGSREFDVSFRSAEKLALFLRVYEEKREQEDCWENFVVLGRSKSSLKTLFILFRNETVDVEDIVTWLKRHCDVLAVPVKVTDSQQGCVICITQVVNESSSNLMSCSSSYSPASRIICSAYGLNRRDQSLEKDMMLGVKQRADEKEEDCQQDGLTQWLQQWAQT